MGPTFKKRDNKQLLEVGTTGCSTGKWDNPILNEFKIKH